MFVVLGRKKALSFVDGHVDTQPATTRGLRNVISSKSRFLKPCFDSLNGVMARSERFMNPIDGPVFPIVCRFRIRNILGYEWYYQRLNDAIGSF